MRILLTDKFVKAVDDLPRRTQDKLDKLLEFFKDNPYHPLLHTKPLSGGMTGFLSFRITREWRVVFQFIDPHTIQLLNVAHRKDIYR